jgi:outer membrane receptor protein involved in Fe transport
LEESDVLPKIQETDRAVVFGFTVSVVLQRNPIYPVSGFESASYARVTLFDAVDSAELPNSVEWFGNAGLSYQFVPRTLSASVTARNVGPRKTWDSSTVASSTLVDLSVTCRRILNVASLNIGLTNLFDRQYRVPFSYDYAPPTTIGQPGRSVFVRLRVGK